MKLLLDQGLPFSASALLRIQKIHATHVGEIGMEAAEDQEIIQYARNKGYVVVTLDSDFHTILALSMATTPSVIRIRIQRLRSLALTTLLLAVIAKCREDLMQGSAITVDQNRIRVRRLPLVSKNL